MNKLRDTFRKWELNPNFQLNFSGKSPDCGYLAGNMINLKLRINGF